MTEFDAALILDPATSESALAQYPDCESRRAAMEEACRVAVKVMRRGVRDLILDTTKMVPLTLDQLREMDGHPVRVHNLRPAKKKFEWQNAIVCKFRETAEHSFYTYRFSDYGKTWLAYAYPPAHINREAWEPCGECEKKSCDNCLYSEYLSYLEPCKSCENASKWKPMQNFCGECGRPLTEEAWAELEKRLMG